MGATDAGREGVAGLVEVTLFQPFPSISRLSRGMIVTEKLDGTNAQVFITEDLRVLAGSRNRWITPEDGAILGVPVAARVAAPSAQRRGASNG